MRKSFDFPALVSIVWRAVRMKFFWIFLVAGLGFASTVSAEPRVWRDLPLNYVAAIVNETIITQGQVESFTRAAIETLIRTYQNPDVLEQKIGEVLKDGLEQLIENRLVLDDFKSGGAKVPDAIVEDEIKERLRQRGQSRVSLTKELEAEGKSYESFKQEIREEIVLNFMRHKNVSSEILISPQKIERYYTTNLHDFQLDNQVKLRMIILNCSAGSSIDEVRKLAQEISLKIDEGASFAEMATIYSEGSARKDGGDWGWREESKIIKGLADVVSELRPSQHTGVIGFARETNDIYWIYQYDKAGQPAVARKYSDKARAEKTELLAEKKFQTPVTDSDLPAAPQEFRLMLLEDKRVARTESLVEVRERIEKELVAQERERLRKRWVERLRAKAFVRFF